jgi:UDP-N-acetylmuramoyl-tripeptide--D-alanyl-D-alanine ligase
VSVIVSARRGGPTASALVRAAVGDAVPSIVVLLDAPSGVVEVPPGAVVVASADDAGVLGLARSISPAGSVVSVGYSADADVRAADVAVSLDGTVFTAVTATGSHTVRLRLVGERHVPAALAALAAAVSAGVEPRDAVDALATVSTVEPGDLEVVARAGGSAILADGYDLSPASTVEALKTLAETTRDTARSIAVLGELDLGDESDPVEVREAHDRIGRLVVRLNVDRLVVVGQRARHIHNAAGLEGSWDGESVLVDTLDEAYDLLNDTELLPEGPPAATVLLVKAAASARLTLLADAIGRGAQTSERVTA